MKKQLLLLGILATATTLSQAALVSWESNTDDDWDTGSNWDTNAVPVIDGTDTVAINNGTVTRTGNLDFLGGSDLTMTGNSTLTVTGDFYVRNNATISVESGSTLEMQGPAFYTYGSSVYDLKGTLIASGPSSNAIKAPAGIDAGGFDFTAVGAKLQFDNFTSGSETLEHYLTRKASVDAGNNSFYMIDGTKVFGFGSANAVGGKYLEFSGTTTEGALTLVNVPEPSSAALLGLGGLALILRRRK